MLIYQRVYLQNSHHFAGDVPTSHQISPFTWLKSQFSTDQITCFLVKSPLFYAAPMAHQLDQAPGIDFGGTKRKPPSEMDMKHSI